MRGRGGPVTARDSEGGRAAAAPVGEVSPDNKAQGGEVEEGWRVDAEPEGESAWAGRARTRSATKRGGTWRWCSPEMREKEGEELGELGESERGAKGEKGEEEAELAGFYRRPRRSGWGRPVMALSPGLKATGRELARRTARVGMTSARGRPRRYGLDETGLAWRGHVSRHGRRSGRGAGQGEREREGENALMGRSSGRRSTRTRRHARTGVGGGDVTAGAQLAGRQWHGRLCPAPQVGDDGGRPRTSAREERGSGPDCAGPAAG